MKKTGKLVVFLVFIIMSVGCCLVGCGDKTNTTDREKPIYPPPITEGSGDVELDPVANLDASGLFSKVRGISGVELGAENPEKYQNAYPGAPKNGIKVSADAAGGAIYYTKVVDLNSVSGSLINFEGYYNKGVSDITRMDISLVDIYDLTNVVTVGWWQNGSMPGGTYMLVSCNGVSMGRNNENGSHIPRDTFGTINWLNGYREGVDASGHYPFNFRYDVKTNQVLSKVGRTADGKEYVVLDVDDVADMGSSSAVFKGFTTGEVYIKIAFTEQTLGGAICVSSIGGRDVSLSELALEPSNNIMLDMDYDYYNNKLPAGVAGVKYPLPKTRGKDIIRGAFNTKTTLVFGGEDITKTIANNEFTPNKAGDYTLTYSAVDINGLSVEREYKIKVNNAATPIKIVVEESVGEQYNLFSCATLPTIKFGGGNGKLESDVKYYLNNDEIAPDIAGKFYINSSGKIKIVCEATDFLGSAKKEEKLYAITGAPKIKLDGYIPYGIKKGSEFIVPNFSALDYGAESSSSGYELEKSTYIDGVKLENESRAVTVGNAEFMFVEFYGAKGGAKEVKQAFNIKIINPAESQDISGYFITEQNVSATAADEGVLLSATKGKTATKLANAVSADYLEIAFAAVSGSANFDYIQVELEDSVDSAIKASFRIYKDSKKSILKVRDINKNYNDETVLTEDFAKGSSFNFYYQNSTKTLLNIRNTPLLSIKFDDFGNAFRGLTSGAAKFTISFGNQADAPSKIYLKKIGNQGFGNSNYRVGDGMEPQVALSHRINDGIHSLNEEFVVPSAKAYDVLQYQSFLTVSLIAPDGTVTLPKADPTEAQTIKFTMYGTYKLVYNAEDFVGKRLAKSILLTVVDEVSPTLSVSGEYKKEYCLGETIELLGAEFSDNYTKNQNLLFYIMVRDTELTYTLLKLSDKFRFLQKGYYTITYYVCDEAQNATVVTFSVFVY